MNVPPLKFNTIMVLAAVAIGAFSFPRLYSTIKDIRKDPPTIDAPFKILQQTLTWTQADKPTLTIEWTGICSSLNSVSKNDGPERRRFYLGAALTNKTKLPMRLTSLKYILMMHGVDLFNQTITASADETVIASGESKTLNTSTFLDRDIIVGILEGSIQLSASAQFTTGP